MAERSEKFGLRSSICKDYFMGKGMMMMIAVIMAMLVAVQMIT